MTDAEQREAARQFYQKWKGKGNEEDCHSYWFDILLKISIDELQNKYTLLDILISQKIAKKSEETIVSKKAGYLVGEIYDSLLSQYADPTCETALKSLNELCVRIVFCLYAEDAGIFGRKNMFHDYIARCNVSDCREKLMLLFEVLNQPPEKRDKYLQDDLKDFPYVNGGLFENVDIEIPPFSDEVYKLILEKASEQFDWSGISPTVFGAVFESTLTAKRRHAGGMHYTSVENIHKVIDPLFLDELTDEFNSIIYENALIQEEYRREEIERENALKKRLREAKAVSDEKNRERLISEIKNTIAHLRYEKSGLSQRRNASINQKLDELELFHNKLASLTFLDPACGSGNFLTETYISLRRLENRVILEKNNIRTGLTSDCI